MELIFPMKTLRILSLVGAGALCFLGAFLVAQEIVTPAPDGLQHHAHTAVKLHAIEAHAVLQRGAVAWFYRRVKLDAANDTEVAVDDDLIAVSRPIAASLTDTVQHGGQDVTLQTALTIMGKFGEKYRTEDQ